MSIWEYSDPARDKEAIKAAILLSTCPFCSSTLEMLKNDRKMIGGGFAYSGSTRRVWVCPNCGWWKATDTEYSKEGAVRTTVEYGAAARLRNLDLSDVSLPVNEVRDYLTAKYESRLNLHPRLFEETVASVFRDHGYAAEATAYSNDGGIDVVLRCREGEQIGIQVKRYKGSVAVEQIRAFAGALWLKGYTKGIFVTTSKFQKGANRAAQVAAFRGIPIELIDAVSFFDALKLAQREMYRTKSDPTAPFNLNSYVLTSSVFHQTRIP